jgi:hypothetical protein
LPFSFLSCRRVAAPARKQPRRGASTRFRGHSKG